VVITYTAILHFCDKTTLSATSATTVNS